MRSIEFSFENPWLLLAALPALALILLFCRRMRRAPGAPRPERWALALRVAEAALAVLILAQVSLTSYTARRQTIVLADRSDSMAGSQEAVEDCLALMAELAGEEQPLQVMDFAASWGPLRQPQDPAASLDGSATDLEAALTAAAGSFSPNGGKRIVLLTDGVPTDGSVEAALEHLEGIRVDVIPLDGWAEAPEAQLTSLELPAGAAEGQRVTANVTALSNETSPAQLSIYDGDALAYQEQVSLVPGENRFSCSLTAGAAGSHAYRAELVSQADTLTQNNWGYALMNVNQGVEILIVDGTGDQSPKLQQLLTQAGYAVTCLPSGQMPSTVTDLCAYGLVILMNVDARDLPEGSAENLEAYVSEYGRGVLTTGGENTYFYGNMAGTAFERFLPVDILIQQTQSVDPIALLLVIDVTDSMTRQSLGVPIEMARRSAVKCVNALNSNDYVGVITFSDEAQVLMEMTTVQDKAAVIQAIEGIQTVGPEHLTKFTGALSAAYSQLASFQQLDRKHVLFITDGNPSDKDFEGIVRDMKAQGITLSTIAVGKLNTVVELLQELAAIGGGRCYMVESAYDLPDIVTMDTALLQVDYTIRQPFTPPALGPRLPRQRPKRPYPAVRLRPRPGQEPGHRGPGLPRRPAGLRGVGLRGGPLGQLHERPERGLVQQLVYQRAGPADDPGHGGGADPRYGGPEGLGTHLGSRRRPGPAQPERQPGPGGPGERPGPFPPGSQPYRHPAKDGRKPVRPGNSLGPARAVYGNAALAGRGGRTDPGVGGGLCLVPRIRRAPTAGKPRYSAGPLRQLRRRHVLPAGGPHGRGTGNHRRAPRPDPAPVHRPGGMPDPGYRAAQNPAQGPARLALHRVCRRCPSPQAPLVPSPLSPHRPPPGRPCPG